MAMCLKHIAFRRLFKESDKLFDSEVLGDINPIVVVPFVPAFKAMNKVVECCFATKLGKR